MSRAAASKTRGADKTKPPASQTPVIAHEIVPGKFNDNDWNAMVDRDGADDYVHDIMDELMGTTMSAIYDKYIQNQLLPFTITQARDAITEIIEWQFLARDEGELHVEADLGWSQDEEPEPAVTDCWAQGSVPRNLVPLPEVPEEIVEEQDIETEAILPQEEEEQITEPPELPDTVSEPELTPKPPSEKKSVKTSSSVDLKVKSSEISELPPQRRSQPRKKFRPYKGKLKSAGVRKMTESLDDTEMKMMYDEMTASVPASEEIQSTILNMPASCTSILKVQTGRPPGNKDVVYDDFGNVVAVMKLDPEAMPTHKVSVKYHVVDPAVEAAQARLDAMRKGKSTGKVLKKVNSKKSMMNTDSIISEKKDAPKKKKRMLLKPPAAQKKPAFSSTNTLKSKSGTKMKVSAPSSTMAPLPPPLSQQDQQTASEKETVTTINPRANIEEMEVSHGVIIREGGRVKKGPGRYYGKLDVLEESQKGMNPVALRLANPDISVADLLDRHTPILRPLQESSPLPPIVHQQQQQAQHAV